MFYEMVMVIFAVSYSSKKKNNKIMENMWNKKMFHRSEDGPNFNLKRRKKEKTREFKFSTFKYILSSSTLLSYSLLL